MAADQPLTAFVPNPCPVYPISFLVLRSHTGFVPGGPGPGREQDKN
jgi:hypothetical protein